jgi:hypothetical protein
LNVGTANLLKNIVVEMDSKKIGCPTGHPIEAIMDF